jgi:hypothetical protein
MNELIKNDTVAIVTSFITVIHIVVFTDHNVAVAIEIALISKVAE